eukprot:6555562-Lingulodinium_polyedra.AAC.1
MKEEIGGKNKKELAAALEELGKPEWVAKYVHAVKLKDTRVIVTVSMATFKHRELLVDAMAQAGAQHKTGVAPAGYLEEELSAWCDELVKTLD